VIIERPKDGELNIEVVESRFSASLLDDLVDYHFRKKAPKYRKFQRLYEGRAKIYNKRKSSKNKPCNKLANDYFGQIIDTTVGYFLGNPVIVNYADPGDKGAVGRNTAEADVGVDLDEIRGTDTSVQDEINGIFTDNYKDDLFMEWGKEAMIKSLSHLLVYQDEESVTRIIKLKPEDVIIVYDNSSTKKAQYKIRLYEIDTEDTDRSTLYAEVYSATKMELFKREDDAVAPGSVSGFQFVEEKSHIYGKIPIITLYNNEEELSDLEKIESLVNDYDRVMSDVSDEFEAFRNAYLVIKDMVMNGDSLQKLKEEGIVEVTDQGDMRFVTKEIQTDAINSHLDRLEKNIHKFAQVPDLSDESFAGNLSGVAIRFKLFGLETKCITKERKMDKAIRQLLEVLSVPVRVKTGQEIDLRNVTVEFSRNVPNNITEIVDTVTKLDGKVDKETLLSLLPFVDNPKDVLDKLEKEAKEQKKQADPYSFDNIQEDGNNPFPNLNANNQRFSSLMGGTKEE
jgi:SPP1 family phage portal protein